jgi:2'-5' RNA ligase
MGSATWSEDQAEAASFLAVVPPESIAQEIFELQRSAGVDTSVLPHVTVKSQPALGDVQRWRPSVADALSRHAPFELEVGGVRWFGRAIVYLAVRGPIVDLHQVVLAAVERVVDEDRFEYDGEGYEAHLTLAAEFAGAAAPQLVEVAGLFADRRYKFSVESVVEFRRHARGDIYRPVGTLTLGGDI